MGTYYLIANHDRREWICLNCVGLPVKDWALAREDCAPRTAWLFMWLLERHWRAERVEFVGDYDEDRTFCIEDSYDPVAAEVAHAFNHAYSPRLKLAFKPCGCEERDPDEPLWVTTGMKSRDLSPMAFHGVP